MRDLRVSSLCSADDVAEEDVWELRRPPAPSVTEGKFVTTAAMNLAVTLNVDRIPREGVQIRADSALSSPGGGYVVAEGVRRQGVETWVASPLGTGPNSHSLRRSLSDAGIRHFATSLVGDVGVGVTMVEGDGKAAMVIASGVESEPSAEILGRLSLGPGDLVHVDGADLVNEVGGRTLVSWVEELPEDVKLVFSVSPEVGDVSPDLLMRVLKRTDLLTMNVREAATVTDVLNAAVPGTGVRHVLRPEAAVVRRTGPLGCEVQTSVGAERIQLPAFNTKPVDTTGVGDAHVAVMCASLLLGFDLPEACRRANAGAALVLSHQTAFPLPTIREVEAVLEEGAVPLALTQEGCTDVQ